MARTLEQLRVLTLGWLDSPMGDIFAPGGDFSRLDGLINEGYEHLVAVVDESAKAWNVADSVITIAVTSAAREYAITPASGSVRKPIDVCRVVSSLREPIDVVPFSERHRRGVSRVPRPSVCGPYIAVYFYRRSNGTWMLGFCDQEPDSQTIEVTYSPALTLLADPTDEPVQVPPDWQRLIGLYAAILGKMQTRRDLGGLDVIYSEQITRMQRELEDLMATKSRAM